MNMSETEWEPDLSCVICSLPRSGSNLLAYALEDTGLAGRPREYFASAYEAGYAQKWGLPERYPLGIFLKAMAAYSMTANRVSAVKIHFYDFMHVMRWARSEFGQARGERELLETCFPHAQCIFLRRADRVRQAISLLRAQGSAQWERRRDASALEESLSPQIDPGKIGPLADSFRNLEEQWREFFGRNEIGVHEIVYEDFVSNYQGTVNRALGFLGLMPPGGVQLGPARTVRQTDDFTERVAAAYAERVSGQLDDDAGDQTRQEG